MKTAFRRICLAAASLAALSFLACPNPTSDDKKEEAVATITGTISLPGSVANKPYLVIVDADSNGGNGYAGISSDSVDGNSFVYSVGNIPAGTYYVYAITYGSGETGGVPGEGDYFGAYGISVLSQWPNSAPKVTIDAGETRNLNFSLYDASGFGSGGGTGYTREGDVGQALAAIQAGMPAPGALESGSYPFPYSHVDANGYTVSGTLYQQVGQSTLNGTLNLSSSNLNQRVTSMTFNSVATDGNSGTATIAFSDTPDQYTFNFAGNILSTP